MGLSPFEEGFFLLPRLPIPSFSQEKSAKEKWGRGYPLVEMDRKKRINSGHVPEGREDLPLPPFFPFAACQTAGILLVLIWAQHSPNLAKCKRLNHVDSVLAKKRRIIVVQRYYPCRKKRFLSEMVKSLALHFHPFFSSIKKPPMCGVEWGWGFPTDPRPSPLFLAE